MAAVNCQLVATSGGIDLDSAMADHLQAVGRLNRKGRANAPPDNRPEQGLLVLQGEVEMPRAGGRQVGHLARHPDVGEPGFQPLLDAGGQLRHALGIVWSRRWLSAYV